MIVTNICLMLIVLAQLSAFVHTSDSEGLGFLSSLDGVEFHGKAYPGDKLDLHYELTRNRRGFVLGKRYCNCKRPAYCNYRKTINISSRLKCSLYQLEISILNRLSK